MKRRFTVLSLLLLLFTCNQISHAEKTSEALPRKALSENATESAAAIAGLRAMGPSGLQALFEAYAHEIDRHVANPLLSPTPEWQRLSLALDSVSQQKDSYLSGLYWYTDLDQARAASRAAGKPILSLRLLGKLNEEFSCANSRFFRTVLYANAEVSKVLRENFILHWHSVRPAPRVTIDFGDGRKLERTVTGNSIHYVLDSSGRPLDAFPGLYGPKAFLRGLLQIDEFFKRVKDLNAVKRAEALNEYHRAAAAAITADWLADTKETGGKIPASLLARTSAGGSPQAVEIAPLAMTKMVTEVSILRAITRDADALGAVTDEAAWTKIALRHISEAQLDERSIGLIKRQTQNLLVADGSRLTPDTRLTNLVQKLQLNIALDTVRNEYALHTQLHAWLVADPSRRDVDLLNKKVYAELFLTPKSDPWLGLFSADTYTALENGGVVR